LIRVRRAGECEEGAQVCCPLGKTVPSATPHASASMFELPRWDAISHFWLFSRVSIFPSFNVRPLDRRNHSVSSASQSKREERRKRKEEERKEEKRRKAHLD
jgi:hypothetical protein